MSHCEAFQALDERTCSNLDLDFKLNGQGQETMSNYKRAKELSGSWMREQICFANSNLEASKFWTENRERISLVRRLFTKNLCDLC